MKFSDSWSWSELQKRNKLSVIPVYNKQKASPVRSQCLSWRGNVRSKHVKRSFFSYTLCNIIISLHPELLSNMFMASHLLWLCDLVTQVRITHIPLLLRVNRFTAWWGTLGWNKSSPWKLQRIWLSKATFSVKKGTKQFILEVVIYKHPCIQLLLTEVGSPVRCHISQNRVSPPRLYKRRIQLLWCHTLVCEILKIGFQHCYLGVWCYWSSG